MLLIFHAIFLPCGDRFPRCCIGIHQRHGLCLCTCIVYSQAIKAVLCIEINYCCHNCRRLFPQWSPRPGCSLCTVHCSSVHSFFMPEPSARCSLFFAYFANVSVLRLISLQQAYVTLSLAYFASMRIFRYFAVYGPLATIF
jgi:hypothetical protein